MTPTANGTKKESVLSLQGVSKQYGTVQALLDVSLECLAGEVHAVVGENGSGKSTLLGIASGAVDPDQGKVLIGGHVLTKDSPALALKLGLGMAYQENSQVLSLSIAENLYLAAPKNKRPSFPHMHSWAEEILSIHEFDYLFPDAPVFTLSLAERQLLEVTKAMLPDPIVLLLDEPTTALGPEQVDIFHRMILNQAKKGVGIVYVSHRLAEVLTIADRVTVLRDGRSQGTHDASSTSEDSLVSLMIGRPIDSAFPARNYKINDEEVALEVKALQGPMFGPLDFKIARGEILGIAGAEGNGQEGMFLSLAGRVPPKSGVLSCAGQDWFMLAPTEALRAGILLLPGDRKNEALFPVLGVRSNSTVQVLKKFSFAGWINAVKERRAVAEIVKLLKVRTPSLEQPVRFLSGGNQQKVALTRTYLRGTVNVILAYEPTQGVDAGARFDIYEALRAKAAEGAAIIVKSSDPIELAGFCDRVIVMSRGQITTEILKEELSEKKIIESIVGNIGVRYEMVAPAPSLSVEEQAQGKGKG